jgi:hypothetical protein
MGLIGWHLARVPQKLAVVVVLPTYGFARSFPFGFLVLGEGSLVGIIRRVGGIRTVGMATSLAPRRAVRVTAEASVATFHQIPPGP